MADTKAPTIDNNPVGTAVRKVTKILDDLDEDQRGKVASALAVMYPIRIVRTDRLEAAAREMANLAVTGKATQ